MIAEAQKRGGSCAFIDAEHALDGDYAARVGVAHDQLYVAQPDSGEQAATLAADAPAMSCVLAGVGHC